MRRWLLAFGCLALLFAATPVEASETSLPICVPDPTTERDGISFLDNWVATARVVVAREPCPVPGPGRYVGRFEKRGNTVVFVLSTPLSGRLEKSIPWLNRVDTPISDLLRAGRLSEFSVWVEALLAEDRLLAGWVASVGQEARGETEGSGATGAALLRGEEPPAGRTGQAADPAKAPTQSGGLQRGDRSGRAQRDGTAGTSSGGGADSRDGAGTPAGGGGADGTGGPSPGHPASTAGPGGGSAAPGGEGTAAGHAPASAKRSGDDVTGSAGGTTGRMAGEATSAAAAGVGASSGSGEGALLQGGGASGAVPGAAGTAELGEGALRQGGGSSGPVAGGAGTAVVGEGALAPGGGAGTAELGEGAVPPGDGISGSAAHGTGIAGVGEGMPPADEGLSSAAARATGSGGVGEGAPSADEGTSGAAGGLGEGALLPDGGTSGPGPGDPDLDGILGGPREAPNPMAAYQLAAGTGFRLRSPHLVQPEVAVALGLGPWFLRGGIQLPTTWSMGGLPLEARGLSVEGSWGFPISGGRHWEAGGALGVSVERLELRPLYGRTSASRDSWDVGPLLGSHLSWQTRAGFGLRLSGAVLWMPTAPLTRVGEVGPKARVNALGARLGLELFFPG